LPYISGNHEARIRYWDPIAEEYYFDRHPNCFESILQFYQTGGVRLERPHDIPLHVFEDEVQFFDLGTREVNRMLDEEGFVAPLQKEMPENLLQRKIWLLLEYQDSSQQARIVSYVSISAIAISTFCYCADTMETFQPLAGPEAQIVDMSDVFFFTEMVCLTFFTLEFLLRFLSSPNKVEFMRGLMNIIDFIAIIPSYMEITIAFSGGLVMAPNKKSCKCRISIINIFMMVNS
jgi:hypothetical protein